MKNNNVKNEEKTKEKIEDLVHGLGYDLVYPQIEALIYIYDQTELTREFKMCPSSYKKYMIDLIKLGLVEGDDYTSMSLSNYNNVYNYSKFRITPKGIGLYNSIIRQIKKEKNLTKRERVVIWANKQGPIWPFFALIVSGLSLIISVIALCKR